jgi:hypothetical protein
VATSDFKRRTASRQAVSRKVEKEKGDGSLFSCGGIKSACVRKRDRYIFIRRKN